jgi:UPF0755 protein
VNDTSLAAVVDLRNDGGRGRRGQRAAERRRKRRRRRTWVSVLIGLLVIGGAASVAWFTIKPVIDSMRAPNDYPGPGTGAVMVTIDQGDSGTDIGIKLQKAGVVKSVNGFTDAAKKDPRATGISPGVYELKLQMASAQAIEVLSDRANQIKNTVLLTEGLRTTQVVDEIAKQVPRLTKADLQKALADPESLGLPEQAKGVVEGWLFPATYDVTPQTTATGLLSEMVSETVKQLTDQQVPPAKWLSTITMASLVQAESGKAEDDPKIARVLQNRLDKKMRLQLDTTVNYALKRQRVGVTVKDTQVVSPYNTYLHDGLPPGAICNPGAAAIQAALNPVDGPWLYFVAVDPDSGLTKYATTEAEFTKLRDELNKWLKAHPGR